MNHKHFFILGVVSGITTSVILNRYYTPTSKRDKSPVFTLHDKELLYHLKHNHNRILYLLQDLGYINVRQNPEYVS